MTEVKKFKALERLKFNVEGLGNECNLFEKYFNGLQSLTHLKIQRIHNSNDILKDIDIYLPKLRVLYIVSRYPIAVSEEAVDTLARLSTLEILDVLVNYNSIKQLIIDKVMKNCRKIKSIDI